MSKWKQRGGSEIAMRVIEALADRGVFRARDLEEHKISHNWLNVAEAEGRIMRHDRGVWSRSRYRPTQYELLQIRFANAVFWGPTALWLHGAEQEEPETVWLAIANSAQVPTTLEPTTVVIRPRSLEADVTTLKQPDTYLTLRVHAVERARRDVARTDFHKVLERAASRDQFRLPSETTLLSQALARVRKPPPICAPPEEWVAK